MSDITNENYWKDSLELMFTMEGFVNGNGYSGKYDGRIFSSTLLENIYGEFASIVCGFDFSSAGLITDYDGVNTRYPVRLIQCKATGIL